MSQSITALAITCAWSVLGSAPSLTILTENYPPAQFIGPHGELTGYTVELVTEIQKRVGNTDPIDVVPWARGYEMVQTAPNVVLFMAARNAERNAKFHWVGPILETVFGFYAKADSSLAIGSLEEARKVGSIGVYRDDVRDQFLTKAGFTNLDRANNPTSNVKKLMGGRIDMIAEANTSISATAAAAGCRMEELRLVFPFERRQTYIIMSKSTAASVPKAWNDALATMKKDGTFVKILMKYYPATAIPGPTITEFK